MKSIFKILAIFMLAAVIGLSMTACDNGGSGGGSNTPNDNNPGSGNGGNNPGGGNPGGGNPGGGNPLGETLTLSGQVWTYDYNASTYSQFTGNRTITAHYWENGNQLPLSGGTGAITGGQLAFAIGAPSASSLMDIELAFDINHANYSDPNAKALGLGLYIGSNPTTGSLHKVNAYTTSTSEVEELVVYFYVDRDVTASANIYTETVSWGEVTINAFNLNIKKGWNSVYIKDEYTTPTTLISTISLADPSSLRWVLWE